MSRSIKEIVAEALRNARENGYGDDIDGMSVEQLAQDLVDLDSDVEAWMDAQLMTSMAHEKGAWAELEAVIKELRGED